MKNREIKFRIWDVKNEKYIELPTTYHRMAIGCDGGVYNGGYDCVHEEGFFIPQQCTGIKDKNGKEIYEGDILKTTWQLIGAYFLQGNKRLEAHPDNSFYEWMSKVVWSEAYASFLLEYIDQPNYKGRGNFKDGMIEVAPWGEVIGNIHENPELLNEYE